MEINVSSRGTVLTAVHEGGMRFTAEVRGHRIETDQPVHGGGEDAAAMPLELMGAALGTCVALYVHQFLTSRGLPTEGLRVETGSEMAHAPKRIGAFDLRVILPDGVDDEHRERIARVAASCPAHNTLLHPPEIRVSLERASFVTVGS
jgi:putative redox protein